MLLAHTLHKEKKKFISKVSDPLSNMDIHLHNDHDFCI